MPMVGASATSLQGSRPIGGSLHPYTVCSTQLTQCVAHGMVQRSVGPATTQARIAATSDGTGSGSDHAPPNDPYGAHLHGDSLRVGLLRPHEKMRPAVLAPARLVVLRAQRALLAVADDRDPVRPDALGHEVVHRGLRAPLAERHVVFVGAALVAVPLDEQESTRARLQPRRVRVERPRIPRPDVVLVEIEVDIS